MGWSRYAVYWVPGGDLGEAGADWLGWDIRRGAARPGLVEAPSARRYGFHATLRAPFRLLEGVGESEARGLARRVADDLAPVSLGRLRVARLGTFLALLPEVTEGIGEVADAFVDRMEFARAPLSEAEEERRRAGGLTGRQEQLLERWGYPYVFDEFQAHLTLSGPGATDNLQAQVEAHFSHFLGGETRLTHVSLVGEGEDGLFRVIEDLPLGHDAASGDRAASA
ncbi:DUF1045 domain-containing protein [Histidinibacterium lentulum]|uniref:DUF1045 domain-containing protein n=1 Tax=Histidinibacterium lentulum TaxID=2480588 RepID=A0A3N2R4N6_9RHOB|nr:DUF1045 domain-containing protein [Histidinibacterium lentulum]ROU02444.1 DUF1045 domain-containing protein [Histidinibacterium lentulum]